MTESNCLHSDQLYDSTIDCLVCQDCGTVIKSPQYVHDYTPYNFDLSNDSYEYEISNRFHILSYSYAPIYLKMIRDTYDHLKSSTGKVSQNFIPVSIYYGLRVHKPIKPMSIDRLLHLESGMSQRYIKKYSKYFELVKSDMKKLDKRKFNRLSETKYLTELK